MSNHDEAQHRDVAVPPSLRSRGELSADLRRELADARLRLQEAALRAEAHRLLGSETAAAEAVAEQEALLERLRERLDRSVSAAVLHRDVEDVLAAVAAEPTGQPEPPASPPPASPAPRRPALAGAVSLVVALVIGSLAIVARTPAELDVLGAADPAESLAATPDDAPSGTEPNVPSPDVATARAPGSPGSEGAPARGTTTEPGGVAAPAPNPGDDPFGDDDLVGRLQALAHVVGPLNVPAVGPVLTPPTGEVDVDDVVRIDPDAPDVPSDTATPPAPVPSETETEAPLPVDPSTDDPVLDGEEVPETTAPGPSASAVPSDGFVSDTGGQ